MPSGYTSSILNGEITNGKDFLKLCTRAFGVAIELRDEKLNVSTPIEFKPDPYHLNRLEESKLELEKYQNMTEEDGQILLDKEYEENIFYLQKEIEEKNENREKYESVLKEVSEWIPPTIDHEGLKKFAIEQIEKSISFDCGIGYYQDEIDKPKLSAREWVDSKINECKRSMDYHSNHYKDVVDATREKTDYMQKLAKSLDVM